MELQPTSVSGSHISPACGRCQITNLNSLPTRNSPCKLRISEAHAPCSGRPMKLSYTYGCSNPESGENLWLPRLLSPADNDIRGRGPLQSTQRSFESLIHAEVRVCQQHLRHIGWLPRLAFFMSLFISKCLQPHNRYPHRSLFFETDTSLLLISLHLDPDLGGLSFSCLDRIFRAGPTAKISQIPSG